MKKQPKIYLVSKYPQPPYKAREGHEWIKATHPFIKRVKVPGYEFSYRRWIKYKNKKGKYRKSIRVRVPGHFKRSLFSAYIWKIKKVKIDNTFTFLEPYVENIIKELNKMYPGLPVVTRMSGLDKYSLGKVILNIPKVPFDFLHRNYKYIWGTGQHYEKMRPLNLKRPIWDFFGFYYFVLKRRTLGSPDNYIMMKESTRKLDEKTTIDDIYYNHLPRALGFIKKHINQKKKSGLKFLSYAFWVPGIYDDVLKGREANRIMRERFRERMELVGAKVMIGKKKAYIGWTP